MYLLVDTAHTYGHKSTVAVTKRWLVLLFCCCTAVSPLVVLLLLLLLL